MSWIFWSLVLIAVTVVSSLSLKTYKRSKSIPAAPESLAITKSRERKALEKEWSDEFKASKEEAHRRALGLNETQYARYNRLLRELKDDTNILRDLETALKEHGNRGHVPEKYRESYTLKTLSGTTAIEYVSPCDCTKCKYLVHKHMCDNTESNIKDILDEGNKYDW